MTRSRKVARNIATTLAAQALSWGLQLIATLYVPRYLQPTGMGMFSVAISIGTVFSIVVALGTSTVLIRNIARDRESAPRLIATALALRISFGVVAVILGCLFSVIAGYSETVQRFVFIGMCAMMISQVNDVFMSALIGLEEMPRTNASVLVEKVISTAGSVALVIAHAPWWTLLAISCFSLGTSLAMNASYFAPQIRKFTKPLLSDMKNLLTQGWPFLSNAAFVAIYGQADTLLLSKMGPMATVGWYNLGKRLSGTTMVIPVAMTSALLPTLSRLHTEDTDQFASAVHRLFSLMMISVVPFASLLILGPRVILNLLHYGPSFMPTVPVLIVLGYGIILWYISVVAGTALIACDQQKIFSRVTGVSAAVCLPLCAACIWIAMRVCQNGAVGAVVSDVIIEACMVVFYLRALPKGSVSLSLFNTLLRATVAALPLVILLALAGERSWPEWAEICAALTGGLIYIPLCFVMGSISQDDVQLFKSILKRKTMDTANAD